ncbi:TetR/AcrR family transcriptional regulator [Rhodococcus oryzae]|uniref:TetR/AcrR family transcriptional regulator n=1 Tax=Rhodococcus oryzae TaxID=2571143 RepID=A0ABY2REN5_9NOCA|nr:TetR/AcrR family transcriptional regulator [Rhodococcus oryzae]TJZ73248.1 TetR/AcrR family transcriptional regulator [Rhodococcus oryzae]
MSSPDATGPRPRGGSTEKRNAILRAARKVFGRDGYARASIDTIAAEAGVSTRTLYNHFGGKEALFTETVTDSATGVSAAHIATVGRHLDNVTDLQEDLVALGFDLVISPVQAEFADHFAMVRQINSEAAHFPQASLEAWQEAGPRRVHRELARGFERLQTQGLLRPARSERMAQHFLALVGTEVQQRSASGSAPFDDAEIRDIVEDGVRAFLGGYLPQDRGASAE